MNMGGGEWWEAILVAAAGLATVAAAALLHYEGLSALDRWCFGSNDKPQRRGVVLAVLGVTGLHVIQIVGSACCSG